MSELAFRNTQQEPRLECSWVRSGLAYGCSREWGESREGKQGGRTWHNSLIIPEKRRSDLRLSVCLPLLGVLNISVGNKPKFSNTVVSPEYSVTAHRHESLLQNTSCEKIMGQQAPPRILVSHIRVFQSIETRPAEHSNSCSSHSPDMYFYW